MTTSNQLPDFVNIEILKGKSTASFTVQLRWSAQKEFIQAIMLQDSFKDRPGVNEVKQSLRSKLGIALQSYVKSLVYEAAQIKPTSNRNYVEVLEMLEPNDIQRIKEKSIDWTYGTTEFLSDEEKKRKKAEDALKNLPPEMLADLLANLQNQQQ